MSDRSLRSLLSAPVVVAGGVLVAAATYLTWLASRLWFVLDDWTFLLHRSVTGPTDRPLLEAHIDHWVTLPILVYRALFAVFGMRHYIPYGLVNIGLHLAVCVLLAVMLRRAGADPWVCVLVMTLMAFMGPGALDILWDFQMVFLGPAALGLAALVVIDSGDEPRRFPVLAWVLLVLALMCSGAGVVMVAWVATYTLLRRGLRAAVTLAAVPALVFVAWYAAYGRSDDTIPAAPLGRILPFILMGTTNLWHQVLPIPGFGVAVLVVGILAVVLGRSLPSRLRMLGAAGLVAVAFDFLLLAVTRGGWGLESAFLSRYLYPALLLTLPAMGAVLQLVWSALSRHPLTRTGVWLSVPLVFVTFGVANFYRVGTDLGHATHGLSARTVAASTMVQDGDPLLSDLVDRENAPDFDTASLRRADVRRALPGIVPGPQDVLDTAANLKVGVSTARFEVDFAKGTSWRGQVEQVAASSADCSTVVARAGTVLVIPAHPGGSQVRLVVSQDHVDTRLTVGDRRSMVVSWTVEAGRHVHVGTTEGRATLAVTVPPGEVSVCLTEAGGGGE